ncbi:MAG: hypothetical protein IJC80_02525 [Clostridia bacterium]|nr:hypothetical protein [Clostridia bacterium]
MKKRIIAVILAALTALSVLVLPLSASAASVDHMNDVFTSEEERLASMDFVVTSDDPNKDGTGDGIYELYADFVSGEMAIRNKVTGEITLSNPYSVSDSFTNASDKGIRLSQLYINYFTIASGKNSMSTFYSYKDCFAYNQGSITATENGLKVDYSLGEESREFAVPVKISLEKFINALVAGGMTEEKAKKLIKDNYDVFDPDQKYIKDLILTLDPSMRDEMIAKYPLCAEVPFVYLPKGKFDNNATKKILEERLVSANPDYFRVAGEGEEETQLQKDMKELWTDEDSELYQQTQKPNFKMSVTYELTNEGLVASVDASSIVYDKEKYCLSSISVLPYFAATSLEEDNYDKGYIFMPDGSGTIIRFEDLIAKQKYGKLTGSLYGPDYAYYQISEKNVEQYTMPVFGLVNSSENNGTGYFAIIEDGDALATITASTEQSFYASAYASFKYAEYDTYDIDASLTGNATSTTEITVISKDAYDGVYKVNYKFLVADETAEAFGIEGTYDTSYLGMAKLYREYLDKKGEIIKIQDPDENVKLFLEMFGSIKVKEQILTFPVTVDKELTTFQDIINIQAELSELGIDNTSYILKGFYNGGLSASYPSKIKWQKVLGGKKGLNSLLDDAKENGYDVAIDVDFTYAYATKNFSGFKTKRDAVKTLDNRYTTKRVYYAATQTFERTSGVAVSTASFIDLFDSFMKSVEKYDLTFLATRTLGSDLNSDFDKKDYYTREDSKDKVVNLLKYMTGDENGSKFNLITDVGNAYAIPYSSGVLSAPLDSSKYVMASETIPFYGMVYHGSVEFAGTALNMEGDEDFMFLRALENGAALYYTLAKENVEALKFDREYSKYYSVSYDFLKDSIVSTYKEYNKLMKDKQDKYIVDHKFLNDEDDGVSVAFKNGTKVNNSLVVLVMYEGGDGFILNYNSEDVVLTITDENGKETEYIIGAISYLEYSEKEGA